MNDTNKDKCFPKDQSRDMYLIDRPSLAGAVLQTPWSFIN